MIFDTVSRRWRIMSITALPIMLIVTACGEGSVDEGVDDHRMQRIGALKNRLTSDRGTMVVAHRACWRLGPENSLKAINECIRLGVDMVEIDVRRTRDGHLVVIHDDTVDRTTNGTGRVADLTLAEISALRLREGIGGESAPMTESRVPTLEQALSATKNRILVNLDAKGDVRDEAYEIAESLGVTDQVLIKISMGSPADYDLASSAFYGRSHFMPIVRARNGSIVDQVGALAPVNKVAFEVIYEDEGRLSDACRLAAKQASRCWVNTMWENLSPGHSDDVSVVDPDAHWGHLIRLGVNMIQTDRPAALIEYLESHGYR